MTITITATINAGTQGTTLSNQGVVSFDGDGNGTNESTGLTDDPTIAGAADATAFALATVMVPTMSAVALALLALLLFGWGANRLRSPRRA